MALVGGDLGGLYEFKTATNDSVNMGLCFCARLYFLLGAAANGDLLIVWSTFLDVTVETHGTTAQVTALSC